MVIWFVGKYVDIGYSDLWGEVGMQKPISSVFSGEFLTYLEAFHIVPTSGPGHLPTRPRLDSHLDFHTCV